MTLAEWEAAEVEDAPLTVEIDPPADEFVVAMQKPAPEPDVSYTEPIGADGPPEKSVEITLLDSPEAEADDEVSIEPAAESLDITLASDPSETDDAPADDSIADLLAAMQGDQDDEDDEDEDEQPPSENST